VVSEKKTTTKSAKAAKSKRETTKAPQVRSVEEEEEETEATPAAPTPPAQSSVPSELMVGFDFGTNTSCYVVSDMATGEEVGAGLVPTVVGYPKKGIIGGVLPDDRRVYIGELALKNRMYLDLVYPMQDGVVTDHASSNDFMCELMKIINPDGSASVKAVIGMPANSTTTDNEAIRDSIRGNFKQVLLAPEPFLSAMGLRDDSRLADPTYIDPIKSSLFVDIGAGTTDLCLVQGYYPTAEDQSSFPFAGDAIDSTFGELVKQQYPEAAPTKIVLRETKEKFSHVGPSQTGLEMKVLIKGKPRSLEVGPLVNAACLPILDQITTSCMDLIGAAAPELIGDVLQNIIITGGGSQIELLAEELQKRLEMEGYENPCVKSAGAEYKYHVARGAWKIGYTAKDEQWQSVIV